VSRPPWMINGWTVHESTAADVRFTSPDGDEIAVPFDVLAEVVGATLRDFHAGRLAQLTGAQYLTMMAAP
jgi:hypothetical protein